MFDIGVPEVIIVLAILVLLFGAKKLPELAKSFGTSAKELRKGFRDDISDEKKPADTNA
jgi:sec-independent protein translocase protein TatA